MDETTESYYRSRAPEYEQIYYRDDRDRQKELAAQADALRTLARGRAVLELACGTGYWTKIMSEAAHSIFATDLSGEMIAEAQKKTYGCPVAFEKTDMFGIDLTNRSFDLVALGFWFSHHPRQEYDRLFDLLDRAMSDDGSVWMIDNNPPAEGPETNHAFVDSHGNNYKYRWLDDGTRFTILKNYFSGEQLEKIFRPRFKIQSMIYDRCYWSVHLARP